MANTPLIMSDTVDVSLFGLVLLVVGLGFAYAGIRELPHQRLIERLVGAREIRDFGILEAASLNLAPPLVATNATKGCRPKRPRSVMLSSSSPVRRWQQAHRPPG